jgi:hypothetical protein
MTESRRQILQMLADQKITAEEAERLLLALDSTNRPGEYPGVAGGRYGTKPGNGSGTANGAATSAQVAAPKLHAKYLRVLVEADQQGDGKKGPVSVNIRVPIQLLRAGVRLASLIPVQAHQHLDEALSQHGVPMTLSQIKPENLEELVDQLHDLTIDVAAKENQANVKVRVFSE